jgi:hypothetical protein
MIISICRKKLQQNSTSFHDKSSDETGKESMYLNIIKIIYEKAIDCIIVNGEKLKPFLIKSGMR